MSLYKIPLILFMTWDFVSILTPPQPQPKKGEIAKTIAIDRIGVRNVRLCSVRNGQILLCFLEVFSIILETLDAGVFKWVNLRQEWADSSATIFPHVHSSVLSIVGVVIWITGTRLRLAAFRQLGPFFRFEISIQKSHKLITTGPYTVVRHPSYTGMVLVNIGWICYHTAPGSWLRESCLLHSLWGKLLLSTYLGLGLFPTLFVTLGRLKREEDMLHRAFGKEWEAYAESVRWRIVPGIY